MGYDPYSPIAPALINILCVPANRSRPEAFNKCLGWLQKSARVIKQPLNSLSIRNGSEPDHQESRSILCNINAHLGTQEEQEISFFEPNRRPCLILGIFDGSSSSNEASDQELLVEAIKLATLDLPRALSATSLATIPTRLVVFDGTVRFDAEEVSFLSSDSGQLDPSFSAWLYQALINRVTDTLTDLRSQEVELPQLGELSKRPSGTEYRSEDVKRQSIMPSLTRMSTQNNPVLEEGDQIANPGRTVAAALLKVQLGSWSEALGQFAEGARAARDANSPAWHAKALEGILVCLLLLAWSGSNFQIPQNCYPTSRGLSSSSAVHSIAEANRTISEKFTGISANHMQALTAMLPGLLATIMNLYDRSTMGFDNALPIVHACEAKIRMAKLLIIVQRYGSLLNNEVLQAVVGVRNMSRTQQQLEPATVALNLQSSFLGGLLLEAVNDAHHQLAVHALLPVYLTVCQDLSTLNLGRKQGFYLKDILQRLPPVLMEARRIGAVEDSSSPLSIPKSFPIAKGKRYEDASTSVRALLQRLIKLFDLPDLGVSEVGEHEHELYAQRRLASWLRVFKSGDIATKLEVLRCCIRVSDALPDLSGSVHFMSLLLFVVRQTITVRRGLSSPVPLIAAEEQARLATGINNAVQVAKSLNLTRVLASYWDDFMVRDIGLQSRPDVGKLVPHSSRDLSHTTTSGTAKKDPFIYNPFSEGPAISGPSVLAMNETVAFDVLLQNPLEIDIEIEKISLIGEGCSFEATEHSILLSPLCVQTFSLTGIPRDVGSLKVIGCNAKAKNCERQNFLTFNGVWKPIPTTKKSLSTQIEVELPGRSILEITVVESLPNLVVKSTSLLQNSVMLLDGEKTTFTMTLENTSHIDADFVLFSFQDSASRQIQDAIATKDLAPTDMHELQHQLASRPAVRRVGLNYKSRSGVTVPAGSSQTFEFEVLGKPGLTEAVILIDYAYLGKPRDEVEGTFYTRQLRMMVNITVNASVDIPRCNVLALSTRSREVAKRSRTERTETPETTIGLFGPSMCLLQLDLRSIWQSPITFTVERLDPSNAQGEAIRPDEDGAHWSVVATSTLQPTHIERILLPISRIYIADPFEPIPSLDTSNTKRQFVVSASKLSLEAETAAREAFWYREELCRMLRITWKEEYGSRHGDIDVRKGIRLSARMIDALRIEHVQISFSLKPTRSEDVETVTENGFHHFGLKRSNFATLAVQVRNQTQEELRLLLRLQPNLHDQPHNAATDLSKKFIWSGVLQRVLASPLRPGETVEAELGIVALVKSVFEINATAEEVRSQRKGLDGVGHSSERRIWHARSPCLITAID